MCATERGIVRQERGTISSNRYLSVGFHSRHCSNIPEFGNPLRHDDADTGLKFGNEYTSMVSTNGDSSACGANTFKKSDASSFTGISADF